jgi:hypothetical protein
VAEPAGVAVPAWHGVQVPAAGLYMPLGQSVHPVEEPSGEDLPAAQPVQVIVEPAEVLCPAAQAVHAPRLPAAAA